MKHAALSALFVILLGVSLNAQNLDVLHYQASIRFDIENELMHGSATLRIRNADTAAIHYLPLHLYQLTINSIRQDGSLLNYDHIGSSVTVQPNQPIPVGDTIEITFDYEGHAAPEPGSPAWGGCFWNMNNTSFSMGVGFFAPWISMGRHWLPSHDTPEDKATFDMTFTVPDSFTVAGTGILLSRVTTDGKTSFRWVEDHPTATHLFTYAISDYVRISGEWNGIPLEYYVRRADSAKGTSYFSTVPQMLEAFTERYGDYPFGKVGYCNTPFGSMEHQTMISYDQTLFTFLDKAGTTAAHELAHQWWGDCVTQSDYRHTWLSEGFATFSEAVYSEYIGGRDGYVNLASSFSREYRQTVAPSEGKFPLYDYPRTPPSSNYPRTIYQKGAAVLVMLREVMGEQRFFDGMRAYFQTYKYGNASTADFQASMETAHGATLGWFFDEWVFKSGWPVYAFEVVKDKGNPLRIRVNQTQDQSLTPLFKMPIPVSIILLSRDTVKATIATEALEAQEFEFPSVPSDSVLVVRFDPERLILCQQTSKTVKAEAPGAPQGVTVHPLYPNPVRRGSLVTLGIESTGTKPVKISIFDSLGRLALSMSDVQANSGRHITTLPTDNLSAGRYFVYVYFGRITAIAPLLVE